MKPHSITFAEKGFMGFGMGASDVWTVCPHPPEPLPYKSRFFTFRGICLTFKITNGPRTLARGGLGWGPP